MFPGHKIDDPRNDGSGAKRTRVIDTKAVAAEGVAMALFVVIGCGTACGHGAFDAASRLVVAMAFGMGILVLAYAIGHHSGGQINCAVTLSLVLGGQVPWFQGLANLAAQLLGSLLGAAVLAVVFPCGADVTIREVRRDRLVDRDSALTDHAVPRVWE